MEDTEKKAAPELPRPEPRAPGILDAYRGRGKDRDPAVEHPDHYNKTRYEAWDVLDEWFHDDPLIWNAVKYLQRAPHKGQHAQDLKKAMAYIQRRLDRLEGRKK